jgi:gamma-glutamyltranspeptidase / glutathione hydrolase
MAAIGAPGGDSQVQAMLQVAPNTFHFGMDIQEAIDAPRFISLSFPSSFAPYSHYPGRMALEDRFEPGVTDALKELGHEIEMLPAYSRRFASVEAILHQPKTGFLRSGADPRQPAYAVTI